MPIWPVSPRKALLVGSARSSPVAVRVGRILGQSSFDDRPAVSGVSRVKAPLSGGQILYSGMSLTAASTPSL